jgi:hypothetical protein
MGQISLCGLRKSDRALFHELRAIIAEFIAS